jgi:hypothetical protein
LGRAIYFHHPDVVSAIPPQNAACDGCPHTGSAQDDYRQSPGQAIQMLGQFTKFNV